MKKILALTANKAILFITALASQISAFASDGNQGDETRWQLVSKMPQFWIGVTILITLLTLGFAMGRKKERGEL